MKKIWVILAVMAVFSFFNPAAYAQEVIPGIYEKSGALEIYDTLPDQAKEILNSAGTQEAMLDAEFSFERFIASLSEKFREDISRPIRALVSIISVIIVCRIISCFEKDGLSQISGFVGALTCQALLVIPFIELISKIKMAADSAFVFLSSCIPVYSALMIGAGNIKSGASYGFTTIAAANLIPIICSTLVIPMLNILLALAVTSCVSRTDYKPIIDSLYKFGKWALIVAVTVFTSVLSIQSLINMQIDSVTKKTAKLFSSSAIPIVGSAFGDAVSAIQGSVEVVKSGVGAFGVLAALCIFLPIIIELIVWIFVCTAADITSNLFESSKIKEFISTCANIIKMILAVTVSIAAVCVVSTGIVLLAR